MLTGLCVNLHIFSVILLVHHISFLKAGHYLVLSLVEGHKEHVHVLQTRRLLVQFTLQDGVVHEVDAGHASDHYVGTLVARVVPMMAHERLLSAAHHRLVHSSHVGHCTVPPGSKTTVLVESVSLVDSRGLVTGYSNTGVHVLGQGAISMGCDDLPGVAIASPSRTLPPLDCLLGVVC